MDFRSRTDAFRRDVRDARRQSRPAADTVHHSAPRYLRPLLHLSALAVATLAAAGAVAADYSAREVGEWLVSPSSDERGCFITRTYPGPRATTLQFGLDVDGSNRLTILNPNWSIRERERLKLDFRLSKASFPRHLAIGIAAQGKKGFVTTFGTSFPADFAASRFLHVRRGKVPVEEIDLDGSGAAVAALRDCVKHYRGASVPAKSAKEDAGRIPLDPFAVNTDRESRK